MPKCKNCGQCCKDHLVLLTFQDIWEIRTHFPDLHINDAITLYEVDDLYEGVEFLKNLYDPIHLIDKNGVLKSYYLGLKFHSIPQGQSTCHFYNSFKDGCRIHEHKPLVCQCYPFYMQKNELHLQFNGRCLEKPVMDFKSTKCRITLLGQAERAREQYKVEILEWDASNLDAKHTIQNLHVFIMDTRISHPRINTGTKANITQLCMAGEMGFSLEHAFDERN